MERLRDANLDRYIECVLASFDASKCAVGKAHAQKCRFLDSEKAGCLPWRRFNQRAGSRRLWGAFVCFAADVRLEYENGTKVLPSILMQGDAKVKLAMDSVLEHLQQKVLWELDRCIDRGQVVDVARIHAATVIARNSALQALSDLHRRLAPVLGMKLSPPVASFCRPSAFIRGPAFTRDPDVSHQDDTKSDDQSEKTLCDDAVSTSKDPSTLPDAPDDPETSASLSEKIARCSEQAPAEHIAPCPAEMYDLSRKVLPTGQPWRWCGGACRARSYHGPTATAVRSLHAAQSGLCGHCQKPVPQVPEAAWDGSRDPWERLRVLAFVSKCHALKPAAGGPGEEATWVCHVCIGRNPYDGGAGLMELDALCRHYRTKHSKKAGVTKKRTPRPLTVYAPWEDQTGDLWIL